MYGEVQHYRCENVIRLKQINKLSRFELFLDDTSSEKSFFDSSILYIEQIKE